MKKESFLFCPLNLGRLHINQWISWGMVLIDCHFQKAEGKRKSED